MPVTGKKPAVVLNRADLYVGVDCPLKKFIKKQVTERGLKGLCPMIVTADPMIRKFTGVQQKFTEIHMKVDATNEAQWVTNKEPKQLKSVFNNSKCIRLFGLL